MYLSNLRAKEVYEFYIWAYLIKGKFYETFPSSTDLMFTINRVHTHTYATAERTNTFPL